MKSSSSSHVAAFRQPELRLNTRLVLLPRPLGLALESQATQVIFPLATRNSGTIAGNGGALSNLNLTMFPSISALLAYTGTNIPVYVQSYHGGADSLGRYWGGGYFNYNLHSGNGTNFGTCFAGANGGYWLRVVQNPNNLDLAWFGVQSSKNPVSSVWTTVDCTARIQNAINSTPNNGELVVPAMVMGASTLIISNRNHLTIQGSSSSWPTSTPPTSQARSP